VHPLFQLPDTAALKCWVKFEQALIEKAEHLSHCLRVRLVLDAFYHGTSWISQNSGSGDANRRVSVGLPGVREEARTGTSAKSSANVDY
jgi:hypothetical protein